MRENYFSTLDNCYYGIDAAFCTFTNENRTLNPTRFSIDDSHFETVNIPADTCLKGIYTKDELRNIDNIKVFKVGRTTGISAGKLIPGSSTVAIEMRDVSIKFANEVVDKESEIQIPKPLSFTIEHCDHFIGYMKSPLIDEIRGKRRLCFPIKWFDRQLLFHIRNGDFRVGDSGSSLLDKNGYALGLLHAMWQTDGGVYGIASPYFAIMEALKLKICLTPYQIKPGSL